MNPGLTLSEFGDLARNAAFGAHLYSGWDDLGFGPRRMFQVDDFEFDLRISVDDTAFHYEAHGPCVLCQMGADRIPVPFTDAGHSPLDNIPPLGIGIHSFTDLLPDNVAYVKGLTFTNEADSDESFEGKIYLYFGQAGGVGVGDGTPYGGFAIIDGVSVLGPRGNWVGFTEAGFDFVSGDLSYHWLANSITMPRNP